MKELGVRLSMDDLNEMMTAADMNQDGRIDYAGDDDQSADSCNLPSLQSLATRVEESLPPVLKSRCH